MLLQSKSLEKGVKAPDFKLLNTITNKYLTLNDVKGEKGTVIMFICNHCPYVVHVNNQLVSLANDYNKKGFGFVAISSNDANTYPQDGPSFMKQHAINLNYPFPYLYDETQEIAKVYDVQCTPEFFVFDKELNTVYHGQLDDSRPGNEKECNGESIRNVLNHLDQEKEFTGVIQPSIGCSIKWK